jgi:hypothetical protein
MGGAATATRGGGASPRVPSSAVADTPTMVSLKRLRTSASAAGVFGFVDVDFYVGVSVHERID